MYWSLAILFEDTETTNAQFPLRFQNLVVQTSRKTINFRKGVTIAGGNNLAGFMVELQHKIDQKQIMEAPLDKLSLLTEKLSSQP